MTANTPDLARNSQRRDFIGGSDARINMGGDEGALLRLWREKRGKVEPQDLSGNLIVRLLRPSTSNGTGTNAHPGPEGPPLNRGRAAELFNPKKSQVTRKAPCSAHR